MHARGKAVEIAHVPVPLADTGLVGGQRWRRFGYFGVALERNFLPSAAIASGGVRIFARHGSPLTRPRFLPAAVIADSDADPPLGEVRHGGATALGEDAARGARACPVGVATSGAGDI